MDPPHHINTDLPSYAARPQRTNSSTPLSSPGLFSPAHPRPVTPLLPNDPLVLASSPYLHPLQGHRVRETHKALVDLDLITGRKLINHYEVIEELGRGVHGKVKLARDLEHGENVAIKIVPRFSKKRRLGKVTASPQDKTKKEIAILKKIRHPNVVALLEIIDDPELKKIYMVLEHVELGEVIWRKKGAPIICNMERRKVDGELRGDPGAEDEIQYYRMVHGRQVARDVHRARVFQTPKGDADFWSFEHGGVIDEDDAQSGPRSFRTDSDEAIPPYTRSLPGEDSKATSRAPSRGHSLHSRSRAATPLPSEFDPPAHDGNLESDLETPVPFPFRQQHGSYTTLERNMSWMTPEDAAFRGRSPSMADSIVSHMSSIDFGQQPHDPFADDFSYVPCLTIEEARATFRDTVLGLEYLHYEGVVHRDIKPANLLWTKEHRVKISDFGVSYFGRPIREGEPDELVTEAEARDFDDDLELAKTVGTPAFFAPELCYTDPMEEQPKISEQLDVWSLGVTLYCLIFARIPFMAEDEFQMFKKIATEDVFIPAKRLRPVDPHHSPTSTSQYQSSTTEKYRDESDPSYEPIDDLLMDLLTKMLIKNPERRIRLRDVKRHPWVAQGIPDFLGWLDDTDPSRRTSGRKIEVDEREVSDAVVPLTFLERARSTLKKTMGKLMTSGRSDRPESSHSRRRAASSVASSAAGDPIARDGGRRKSLRGDLDHSMLYSAVSRIDHEHRFSHSVSASPHPYPVDEEPHTPQRDSTTVREDPHHTGQFTNHDFNGLPDTPSAPSPAPITSTQTTPSRHGHRRLRSTSNAIFPNRSFMSGDRSATPSDVSESRPGSGNEGLMMYLRKARDMKPADESSRSRSVDRGLFANSDKRAEAKVSLSTVIAPGNMAELPKRPLSIRPPSPSSFRTEGTSLPSPMFFSPTAVRGYHHSQPNSSGNIYDVGRRFSVADVDPRPRTAHRFFNMECQTPPPRAYNSSTPESFSRAFEKMARQRQLEIEEACAQSIIDRDMESNPAQVPCPPSPDDENILETQLPPSRGDTVETTATGISAPLDLDITPVTSPSEVASPSTMSNDGKSEDPHQAFRSDPSLPALLSGASSVSADAEGEFLLRPGNLHRSSLVDTSDSLTPPALAKEPVEGFPLEALENNSHTLLVEEAPSSFADDNFIAARPLQEDDDSDSDEGLVMAKPRRRRGNKDNSVSAMKVRRRDTQTSVGSTDTAKKVVM